MSSDMKTPEQELENERQQSEQALAEIKQVHKGRYPKSVAKTATMLKVKTKNNIPVRITKMDLFMEEYLKNGQHGTNAAMAVFKCESRAVAGRLASAYLAKARSLGRLIMEEKGITYGKLIDLMWLKAQESKDTAFIDRLLKIAEAENFLEKAKSQTGTTVNVMNVHKNMMDKYVTGTFDEAEVIEEEESDE